MQRTTPEIVPRFRASWGGKHDVRYLGATRQAREAASTTGLGMAMVTLIWALGASSATILAQESTARETISATQQLEPTIRALLGTIETLSDYRTPETLPSVYRLPQLMLEAKVCDEPCNVSAAYVPLEGIYLAENLDPVNDPSDRAALLHELVHYLQQGHPKFAHMAPCERERAKEQEAYAIQNAYFAAIGSRERVVFYDSEFDCSR
jgi:hypothetical protein